MKCPISFGEAKYRTIEESRIAGLLLLHGWAQHVRGGGRAQAEREVRAALDRFVALGLPCRKSATGERLFDPVEAVNFVRWAHFQYNDQTLTDRCLPTARRLVCEAHGLRREETPPPPPDMLSPQRYAVRVERTFNLEKRKPGERHRLRLPLPVQGLELSEVETTFMPPEGFVFQTVSAPARLDVLMDCPGDRATVGIRTTFIARPFASASGAALDPAEAELYLRPGEGLIKVSSGIEALAVRLARGAESRWMVLRRFWDFILEELSCGAVHYDQLDPAKPLDWVLEHGWYDCQLGSAVMVALCRASGIPARLVSGYFLHPAAPSFHTWLEAWIDDKGWLPFDLFCWDLSLGGRDSDWRNYYFGKLDHRMVVERPPLLFNGTGSIRLPHAWHRLVAPDGRGSAIEFRSVETDDLVYREYVEIERLNETTQLRPA